MAVSPMYPGMVVSRWALEPSASATQICGPSASPYEVYANHRPSGDHAGESPTATLEISFPSSRIVAIALPVVVLHTNASVSPSGDHAASSCDPGSEGKLWISPFAM